MVRKFFIPKFLPQLIHGTSHHPSTGGCIMQVASYMARGEWHDQPPCVHPVIRYFGISVNDAVRDNERQKLWLLLPRMLNTETLFVRDERFKKGYRMKRPTKASVELYEQLDMKAETLAYTVDGLTQLLDYYDEITGRTYDELPISRQQWKDVIDVMEGKKVYAGR